MSNTAKLGPTTFEGVFEESRARQPPGEKNPSKVAPAIFPIALNSQWRVVDDPLQWILQRRFNNGRTGGFGWESRAFFGTRSGLLNYSREYCGEIDQTGLGALSERHQ